MKKNNILLAATFATALMGLSSCSDSFMTELNTDETKAEQLNPNTQLTTGLLQTYGDFGLMDTYRSYITGFTQHLAGGWNVSYYGGNVKSDNDQMRLIWDKFYSVGIKNLVDAISRTADQPNVNAMLRIHKVYMLSIITDTYGDCPCSEAGLGYLEHKGTPKYDKQEDIYNYFFTELDACIKQLNENGDKVTGDVTAYNGNVNLWKKYANSLRMRFAMRISDVNAAKAQTEFEKSINESCGVLSSPAEDAYVIYTDNPFTLYDGARELDFRVNALGEILYGQDATSPSLICATFYEMMIANNDPRLYRICAHYNNVKRAEDKADEEGSLDVTDEVRAYLASSFGDAIRNGGKFSVACVPGAAWYSNADDIKEGAAPAILSNWVAINDSEIETYVPTLWKKMQDDPDAGYTGSNYQNRMIRPFLSVKMEKGNTPGFLMTSAEVEFLKAEAKLKGWTVDGDVKSHYEDGIRFAMKMLNNNYSIDPITLSEIEDYISANPLPAGDEAQKERINTEAWILHLMNPSEAWANMRRSDYPTILDHNRYKISGFSGDNSNMTTPVRLKYPTSESTSNSQNYKEAIERMGVKDGDGFADDWHHRLWWDTAENTHLK